MSSVERKRVAFVINSIGSGGAERVLDIVLRHAPTGPVAPELHLILLDEEPEMRSMPAGVVRHRLDAGGGIGASVRKLRRALDAVEPDIIVSLLIRANMATILASGGRPWRVVVCERMHMTSHLAGRYRGIALAWRRLMPCLLYRRADRVLAVSPGVARDLTDALGVPDRLVMTIPNPFEIEAIERAGREEPDIALPSRYFVATGRLVAAKGFDDLIEAYRRANPAPSLVILGEGEARGALTARIAAAGLSERIVLAGFIANPFAVVARAEAYLSASHNEGFPNALAEAMVLGRACLVTDCPSGPADLIGAEADAGAGVVVARNGLIVPDGDIEALANGIAMLSDDALRRTLGTNATAAMQAYRADRVAARYWAAFA